MPFSWHRIPNICDEKRAVNRPGFAGGHLV
jgi:hypothetical protein